MNTEKKSNRMEETLNPARNTATEPIALSDLPEDEQKECRGMWARYVQENEDPIDGVILDAAEPLAKVWFPPFSQAPHFIPTSELVLLPENQRAWGPLGEPLKIDPGQWEKTHDMEAEFDRIKELQKGVQES
ncbi:hypothetical protein [Corynebacterium ulcerans]|uniref:hypothetical protein n=1 Tax=Corynebacterium ulcerans TaxID=65058 RepID=UPI0002141C6A|nr:hypothetical protein [Corynebacterium ulcerans]AEG81703.1 hypothetical protein CULC809_01170 [Corynebacterium ulcerans 809]AEG83894.1 hypothetical protein CULC22_01184 [Corynebacterium ulcerans BR-AD22]